MRQLISSVLAVAAGLMLAGCTDGYDDSELRKGLDDLRDRVEQIESKLDKLNGDIETRQGCWRKPVSMRRFRSPVMR